MKTYHIPVLLKEAIEFLNVRPGQHYLDATVGGGGHSLAILKRQGQLLAIDCDPEALQAAKKKLSSACPNSSSWQLALGNFAHLKKIAETHNFLPVAGVLFDLGVASHQLESVTRGFSFGLSGPLDMRMCPDLQVTAADLVNGLYVKELTEIFEKYGDERFARRIAQAICQARKEAPIATADRLAQIIVHARPARGRLDRTHPATQVFQALRIAVNDELHNLQAGLSSAWEILQPSGRLVVISFHSGEDRIVKNYFRQCRKQYQAKLLTKKPVRPKAAEVEHNPRSRSAKLRAIEK